MSIKALALELYRAQRKFDALEKTLAATALGDQDRIRRQLEEVRAERQLLRRMLDGEKENKKG